MLNKPTLKTGGSALATTVAIVAGAKISDGVASIMPATTNSYKKWLLGAAGLILAASVDAKTPTGKAVQNAAIGFGAKQIYDEVSDSLSATMAPKTDGSATSKFINAIVGHTDVPTDPAALAAAWEPAGDVWNQPVNQIASFTGV